MDVICIGEALIDFVSRERGKSLVMATEYSAATGGSPANIAAGLAKLGRNAQLIATVGNDAFGQKILHDLTAVGVDCALRVDPEHFTTLAFVRQTAEGVRIFDFNTGAHDYVLPEQIDADAIRAARVLLYGAISLRQEPSRSATLQAIQIAREAGVLTACVPHWRPALWSDVGQGRAAILEAISFADVLKVSKHDLDFLVPELGTDYDAALRALGFHGRLAAVTLGRDGAWYRAGAHSGQVPSPTVQVVETTGAGDAFMAALIDCLLANDLAIESISGEDLRGIMLRACAAGALTATGYGAIPSLPDKAGIGALMRMIQVGTNGGGC